MNKPRVKEIIIVEGRYDKNTLKQVVDAHIIVTDGFGFFKDRDKLELIKRLARTRGAVVFTDGDGAGFVIRNRIKSLVPAEYLKHAYVPDIFGKERRKQKPSAEGKLGVEGMDAAVLLDALRRAGVELDGPAPQAGNEISKADFFEDGLSGGPDSRQLRARLIKMLDLPERLTANGLLEVLNLLYSREDYKNLVKALDI